jgi:hypothetical protein
MPNPTDLIDKLISDTTDWRGQVFARLRKIIHDADPEITEEWKWVSANRPGTPVWEHNGSVCHVNILKDKVKLTLHEGARLPDPQKQFNAGFDGNKLRAVDIHEGDTLNEKALKALIRAGVELNLEKVKPARTKGR